MSDEAPSASGTLSFSHGDFDVVTTSSAPAKDHQANLEQLTKARAAAEAEARGEEVPEEKSEEEKVAEAAAELGKKGGKAAAEKRKAKPIKALPDKEPEAEAEEAAGEDEGEGEEEDEGEKARKRVAEEIENAKPHEKRKLASERVAEATREAAELKRRVAQLERELSARSAAPPTEPGPAPDKKQFEGREDEYLSARVQHEVERRLAEEKQKEAQAAARASRQAWIEEQESRFTESYKRWREQDPEIGNKVSDAIAQTPPHYSLPPGQSPGPQNFIATEIMASGDPMRLAVYLSENADEYQRLATLRSPREITREMARLEDRVLSAPAGIPLKPAVSKAPPPVRPVTGAPHAAEQGYRPGISLDEYAPYWRKTVARQ